MGKESNTPNRFTSKCVSVEHRPTQRPGSVPKEVIIKDVKWYPDEKKIVIEKYNRPDIVVDVSCSAVTTTKDIYDDPVDRIRVVVKKDTPITEAMQIIVNEMNDNFEKKFVWDIFEKA